MTYDATLPYPRDLIGYGRNPPHANWPGDAKIASTTSSFLLASIAGAAVGSKIGRCGSVVVVDGAWALAAGATALKPIITPVAMAAE